MIKKLWCVTEHEEWGDMSKEAFLFRFALKSVFLPRFCSLKPIIVPGKAAKVNFRSTLVLFLSTLPLNNIWLAGSHAFFGDTRSRTRDLSVMSWPRWPQDHQQVFFFSTILLPAFPCQIFLASHFCTARLSRFGLGNQVGSTTVHLKLLPTQHTERSKYNEGRADRVVPPASWTLINIIPLGNFFPWN